MNLILNRLATPLTLGLFAVSTISGVALFLHVGQGYFHAMHEWLSIVLLAPFVLHVWKNWNPLVIYARRGALLWPVLASVAIAVPFAWPALSGKQQGGSCGVTLQAGCLLAKRDKLRGIELARRPEELSPSVSPCRQIGVGQHRGKHPLCLRALRKLAQPAPRPAPPRGGVHVGSGVPLTHHEVTGVISATEGRMQIAQSRR